MLDGGVVGGAESHPLSSSLSESVRLEVEVVALSSTDVLPLQLLWRTVWSSSSSSIPLDWIWPQFRLGDRFMKTPSVCTGKPGYVLTHAPFGHHVCWVTIFWVEDSGRGEYMHDIVFPRLVSTAPTLQEAGN